MKAKYEDYKLVTYEQIELMKHTIGFDNEKVKGTKYRKYEPWRNYFFASKSAAIELDKLVALGFMDCYLTNYYCVTDDGKQFLYDVLGVEILADRRG